MLILSFVTTIMFLISCIQLSTYCYVLPLAELITHYAAALLYFYVVNMYNIYVSNVCRLLHTY